MLFEPSGEWLAAIPAQVRVQCLGAPRPKRKLSKLLWACAMTIELRRHLARSVPQCCLTFLWPVSVMVVLAGLGLKSRPRIMWSVQSDLARNLLAKPFGALRLGFFAALLRRGVDFFIVPSHQLARSLRARLRLQEKRVLVVPNAVSLRASDAQLGQSSYQWGPGLRVISVGRLHPAKNFAVLLRALSLAKQRGLFFSCAIVGGGDQQAELQEMCLELKLQDQVKLLGARSDISALLGSAQLFVSSSDWETFGVAIAEALLCGLPVVATATDGARDLIVSGRNGVLVEPGDVHALADALCSVAMSLESHLWPLKCREAFEQRLSPINVAQRYADAIGTS